MTRPLLLAAALTAGCASPTVTAHIAAAPSPLPPITSPVPLTTGEAEVAPARPTPTRASRSRRPGLNWTALAACESSNNPQAVNPSGKYRGAFQFDRKTWAVYGPAGDPAAAPYSEQLRRAKALFADRGRSPWPECGRHL